MREVYTKLTGSLPLAVPIQGKITGSRKLLVVRQAKHPRIRRNNRK